MLLIPYLLASLIGALWFGSLKARRPNVSLRNRAVLSLGLLCALCPAFIGSPHTFLILPVICWLFSLAIEPFTGGRMYWDGVLINVVVVAVFLPLTWIVLTLTGRRKQ